MFAKTFGLGGPAGVWNEKVHLFIDVINENENEKKYQIIGVVKDDRDQKFIPSYYSHHFCCCVDNNMMDAVDVAQQALEAYSEYAWGIDIDEGQGTFVNRILCEAGYSPA